MQNKNQSSISLRQNWLWRIPLIATALSLLLTIGLRAIPFVVSSICDNVQGWDGLGCSIYGLYIGRIIIGVPLVILSILLLKRWVINSRSMTALITVPVAVFVAAAVLSNGLDYVSPDFPSDLQGHTSLFILGTISISAVMLIAVSLFTYTNKISRTVSFVACALLIPGIYSLVSFTSHQFRSTQYVQEQKSELKNLSFKVYQPTYIPSGYALETGLSGPGLQPGTFLLTDSGERKLFEPSYYDFTYKSTFTYGGDPKQPEDYKLYEYEANSDYKPPQDCGGTVSIISAGGSTFPELDAYGEQVRPCGLIGQSSAGCDVYYEEHSLGFDVTGLYGYCKIGSTVIALAAQKAFTGNQDLSAQKAEMIKIFDSLKELTPQQLENYALEDSKNRK